MPADSTKVASQEFWHTLFSQEERINYDPSDKLDTIEPEVMSALRLMREPDLPVPLHALNQFSEGAKLRLYRVLLAPDLLAAYKINPITFRGPDGDEHVSIVAPENRGLAKIVVRHALAARDPLAYLELVDNGFNGINVVLMIINDPDAPRFDTDISADGQHTTLFGTVYRNVAAEEAAMAAGLAPGQVRTGLRASRDAVHHLEAFLSLLGHESFYVEPLTYAAAMLFEKRGFSYIHGRRLMETIDGEFRPGGRLHAALDGSTPFRQREQWQTIRGRAWAIHDGILSAIDAQWDDVRMVKVLGRYAGINTFADGTY